MKRLTFTWENRRKTRERIKTQTRRIGTPRYQVGDVVALCEPTQVLTICDADLLNPGVELEYPDTQDVLLVPVSLKSLGKIVQRKNPHKTAIARFMLDDFARHYCQITDVRQELLQDISEEDAIAEGIEKNADNRMGFSKSSLEKGFQFFVEVPKGFTCTKTAKEAFKVLWDSINGKDSDRCWNANPTVVAYTYEYLGHADRPT